jgi:hypothetical protein
MPPILPNSRPEHSPRPSILREGASSSIWIERQTTDLKVGGSSPSWRTALCGARTEPPTSWRVHGALRDLFRRTGFGVRLRRQFLTRTSRDLSLPIGTGSVPSPSWCIATRRRIATVVGEGRALSAEWPPCLRRRATCTTPQTLHEISYIPGGSWVAPRRGPERRLRSGGAMSHIDCMCSTRWRLLRHRCPRQIASRGFASTCGRRCRVSSKPVRHRRACARTAASQWIASQFRTPSKCTDRSDFGGNRVRAALLGPLPLRVSPTAFAGVNSALTCCGEPHGVARVAIPLSARPSRCRRTARLGRS